MKIVSYSAATWEVRHGKIHQPTARWTILNDCFRELGAEIENIRIQPARQLGYYAGYASAIINNVLKSIKERKTLDLVLTYFPYMAPIGYLTSSLGGIPWVADWGDALIGTPVFEFFREFHILKYAAVRFLERTILKKARRVVTNFVGLRHQLIKEGFDRNKVIAISDGVNSKLFTPPSSRHREEIANLKEKLGIEGRIIFYHGKIARMYKLTRLVHILKAASRRIPDLYLLLVGDGDDIQRIRGLAKELGVEKRVIITGALPHEEMPNYVRLADVCVLPFNSGALKIWEWCASGKPVIGLRGYLEVEGFTHDENAYLVKSLKDIPEAVNRVLSDEELAERLGKAAVKLAVEYDWKKVSEKYFDVLEGAVHA